jgi:hypothetical protein
VSRSCCISVVGHASEAAQRMLILEWEEGGSRQRDPKGTLGVGSDRDPYPTHERLRVKQKPKLWPVRGVCRECRAFPIQ